MNDKILICMNKLADLLCFIVIVLIVLIVISVFIQLTPESFEKEVPRKLFEFNVMIKAT
jgi:hypothetical protein